MVFRKIKQVLGRRPKRTREAFDRLKEEAGFIPIFNIDDLEQRRQEIKKILDEVQEALFDPQKQKEIVAKVYGLFFVSGDPWYRGLDDRELAKKVSGYLQNFKEISNLYGGPGPFLHELFEESIQLLNLSWKQLDVTNTPAYIVESNKPNVIMPGPFLNPREPTSGAQPLGQSNQKGRNE